MLCGGQSEGGGQSGGQEPLEAVAAGVGQHRHGLAAGQRWGWREVGWVCECLVGSVVALVNPSKVAETGSYSPLRL